MSTVDERLDLIERALHSHNHALARFRNDGTLEDVAPLRVNIKQNHNRLNDLETRVQELKDVMFTDRTIRDPEMDTIISDLQAGTEEAPFDDFLPGMDAADINYINEGVSGLDAGLHHELDFGN